MGKILLLNRLNYYKKLFVIIVAIRAIDKLANVPTKYFFSGVREKKSVKKIPSIIDYAIFLDTMKGNHLRIY